NLLGAQRHGAEIFARHRFVGARRNGGRWRIELANATSGATVQAVARALVNAAGPWVVDVARQIHGTATNRRLRMVKGSHIVVPRQWEGDHGYFLQTQDGRLMEAFPYEQDFTSIGTTDEPWDEPPDDVHISDREIDYMLAEVNRFLRRPIARADIRWSYAGVRPLFEVGGTRDSDLSTLTRDYSFEVDQPDGQAPALTIYGGKLTTHRRLAEAAVSKLARYLKPPRPSQTAHETLPGGDVGVDGMAAFEAAVKRDFPWLPGDLAHRYVRLYGTRTRALLESARGPADLGTYFGADLYQREVDFLVATEWAQSAADILWRRTKLGLRLTAAEVARLEAYLQSRL
ncbi:MAG: glycerol-3-phosphate dehydrogenase, partial [Dongiaceae bacterium]